MLCRSWVSSKDPCFQDDANLVDLTLKKKKKSVRWEDVLGIL